MNTDIRLSVGFWSHPKTRKMVKHLGLEGIRSLQVLWLWAATNRPDGILSGMDWEDIELAADWHGEERVFFNHCLGAWIDENSGEYSLHDWGQHQDVLFLTKVASGWEPGNRIEDVSPSVWKRLRAEIFCRDKFTCQYCGKQIENPHCDHVTPVSRGGKSTPENLVTSCQHCNLSKGAKLLSEWRQ